MTDLSVADTARATAITLTPELGPDLPIHVEAALHDLDRDYEWPGQYDPLAIAGFATGAAGLIVAIAQLAWSVYTDRRDHAAEPEPETIARQVRIKLREHEVSLNSETDRIADVVITEIIRRGL